MLSTWAAPVPSISSHIQAQPCLPEPRAGTSPSLDVTFPGCPSWSPMAQNSRCCSALRGTSLGERAAPRWEGADPAPASIVGSPHGHRWLCSQLQSLPSIQHWGTQWELVPEHIKAFPAGTRGFSPMTAAVGLTTSLQPWGGALPGAELNLELSNPGKCFPSAPGGLIFLFCSRAGYYFPWLIIQLWLLGLSSRDRFPIPFHGS